MPSDDRRSPLREAWRTFRIARDAADAYGSLAILLPILYVSLVAVPVGLLGSVVAFATVLLVPAWRPWGFLVPAALVALALAGVATVLWVVLRALPRRARALLASARAAGGHALDRAAELRELARRGGEDEKGSSPFPDLRGS